MRQLALGIAIALTACMPAREPVIPPAREVTQDAWSRTTLASGLANPRGLLLLSDHTLLVAEAGTGDPAQRDSGRLLRLADVDGDGVLEDRRALLESIASVNIVERIAVHRDEVFGFADIARGDGIILASVADPTEGSVVWRVDGEPVRFATTADNANSLAWHPTLRRWFAVQSFANTAIDLLSGEVVGEFAELEHRQQAVPSALIYEPEHDALLVALFSGQRGGDTVGDGVDFVANSGRIVRLDPRDHSIRTVVGDLNAPVDLALTPDGHLLVVEFCDAFVDPVDDLLDARTSTGHGGFARFTGRVLEIDMRSAERRVLSSGLDLPTHVLVDGGRVLLTEGQGTPGRTIPGPAGPVVIDGRVIELRPPA